MPCYLTTQATGLRALAPAIVITTVGVVAGTLVGTRLLHWIPEKIFRKIVAVLILALGVYMLAKG